MKENNESNKTMDVQEVHPLLLLKMFHFLFDPTSKNVNFTFNFSCYLIPGQLPQSYKKIKPYKQDFSRCECLQD